MFKLYIGLLREGKWFNYAEVTTVTGGGLAVLDGPDKSGAARFLNLLKKSLPALYTEAGDKYDLQAEDYKAIKVQDVWRIGRETMKKITGKENFIISENFFCPTCSTPGQERYTLVEEDWQDLIDSGFMDEYYLDDPDCSYITELPHGITIEPTRNMQGGTYTRIKREPLSLGDMIKIQKSGFALQSEANMIFAMWDASIVEIEGMSNKELNIFVKRISQDSFCKKYLLEQEDQAEMEYSEIKVGIDASVRSVSCQFCNNEIGGYLDFTNFFQSLLPKKSAPGKSRM